MARTTWLDIDTYDKAVCALVWLRSEGGTEQPGCWREGAWRVGQTVVPLKFVPAMWRPLDILKVG